MRRRRIAALALLLAGLALAEVRAQAPAASLSDGEALQVAAAAAAAYEAGDFGGAEAGYRRLLAAGRDSAEVYYNLGNSLYRLGRIGPAILAYERALRRDPTDTEIRENLEFVRGRIVDRVEEGGDAGETDPLQVIWDWHGRLSERTAVAIFLLAWWLFNACLAGALFLDARRLRRAAAYLLPLVLLAVLASATVLGGLIYRRDVTLEGIVQPSRADLLSAPGEGAVRLTTVHEGLKVRLRARRGDWMEVVLPNGLRGWLPAGSVGLI